MISTRPHTAKVLENYSDATGRRRALRYFTSRGQHVVCVDYPVMERGLPEVHRYRDVREARIAWRTLRGRMDREGYQRAR
jgi:hypothetical protein